MKILKILDAKVLGFARFHRSKSCKYRAKRPFCKVYTTLYRFFTKKNRTFAPE